MPPQQKGAPSSSLAGGDFEAMFRREYSAMVALAAAVAGSRIHAEDIAQEAMTRLEREWQTVRTYEKPGAWLRRVTINLALSEKRRSSSEARARLRLARPAAQMPPEPPEHNDIWRHVAALPKMQRAAVSLYYLEDRTADEIGDVLGVAAATARVHLHRARRSLHKALTSAQGSSEGQPSAPGPSEGQQ